MNPGHTSVMCGRGGTAYLDGVCEDADEGGFWSAFSLCGTGGEGGLGAFCVGGWCWRV